MNFEIWKFLAGLGAFLLSINLIEDALKILASRGFKTVLRKHTNNHVKSIFVGAFSTAILQSSSAVTLMLLAFVGSGLIQFSNALGIILGANLGTTFTGWIVSYIGFKVDINAAIYPILAIGSLTYAFFPSRPRLYQWGKFIFGFGFLFFGLNTMKESMAYLQSSIDLSVYADYHYLIFALVGAIFTAIIQSSSASMTITLTALHAGVIPLEAACALMVGANLGTTATVVIGASTGNYRKKQVAAAHFFFNLVIVIITLVILRYFLDLTLYLIGDSKPLYVLVTFYSLMNLFGIVVFFPFLEKFSDVLQKKFPSPTSNYMPEIVNTSVPEAAITSLMDETKTYLRKTFLLNSTVVDNKIDRPNYHSLKQATGSSDYVNAYRTMKKIESIIIEASIKTQEQPLSEQQSYQLKKVQATARNCSYSLKGMKDIRHNLIEFHNSSSDIVVELAGSLITFYSLWLKQAEDHIFIEEIPLNFFEDLILLSNELEKVHLDFLNMVNESVSTNSIQLKHVPNLFNANREFFSSCNTMIEALSDLFLTKEQNKDFSQIPRNID